MILTGMLLFFILPFLLGRGLGLLLKLSPLSFIGNMIRDVISGQFLMWSFFQILAVPFIFFKLSFRMVVLCWCMIIAGVLFAFFKKGYLKLSLQKIRFRRRTAILGGLVAGILLVQCGMYVVGMHVDFDDSRFITNAVEAYEKNTMLRLHPVTGESVDYLVGDRAKDVVSPWSVYLAFASFFLRVHPAITAHTIYAPVLLLLSYMIYFVIGELLFERDDRATAFLLVIAGMNLFYAGSAQLQSVFALTRLWQGKAVVAAVGIPAYFMVYLMLMKEEHTRGSVYFYMTNISLACCLFSGFGVIGSGLLSISIIVWKLITCRKWKEAVFAPLPLLPALVYGGLYMMIK